MYSLEQITKITSSELLGSNQNVSHFLTDSRELITSARTLFIAIRTNKNDGHRYISFLAENGVCAFMIERSGLDTEKLHELRSKFKDISFIICENTLDAIQSLAKYHRSQFNIPVIGITGSNGKTVVKEWLYQLLKDKYSICRSPKSYNSQLGVPLSILNLNHSHSLAIFEAGISQSGEMEKLTSMINPTIGIITSIGSAHDEGFKDKHEKIDEKIKLVAQTQKVIVNGVPDHMIPLMIRERTILIGNEDKCDFKSVFVNGKLNLSNSSKTFEFEIPFTDEASIQNLSTCIVTLLYLNYSEIEITKKLSTLQPIALRLEVKNGIGNSLLINDFYNSDLDSLKIALSFLQQQNRKQKKAVIISDIEQSGILDSNLYREISELMNAFKIDLVIGIGKKISSYRSYFKFDSVFFENTSEFIQHFNQISYRLNDATILLKGARSFGFENISTLLQQKSHDTVFEINLNKLTNNINHYKLLTGPRVKLMCMVKAMGYGGGSSELAKTLQHIGADYLAVAYADEGVELRNSGILLPIMVMSPETEALEDIINYNLEPEIYSIRILDQFIQKLDTLCVSAPYPVHIKIDTGMHRLGFIEDDIDELVSRLSLYPQIKIQSVFSHLSASDNSTLDDFSNHQIELFSRICTNIQKGLGYSFLKHICNSGGISRFKHAHFDMVRLGIGMHGIGVNPEEQKNLENVSTLKSRISQIKKVKAGQTVGYNRNGKADKNIVIATIPIGYADGFSRTCGNGNSGVYIQGQFCKTIGNICMDMCMIDISNVDCKEGDEVIVFETTEQLNALAKAMGTITYEVLTSVSGRVKRIYIQE